MVYRQSSVKLLCLSGLNLMEGKLNKNEICPVYKGMLDPLIAGYKLTTCQLAGPIAERSKSSDLDCGWGPGFKSRWG